MVEKEYLADKCIANLQRMYKTKKVAQESLVNELNYPGGQILELIDISKSSAEWCIKEDHGKVIIDDTDNQQECYD